MLSIFFYTSLFALKNDPFTLHVYLAGNNYHPENKTQNKKRMLCLNVCAKRGEVVCKRGVR